MSEAATEETVELEIADVTQQRRVRAKIRRDISFGEVTQSVLPTFGFARRDATGKPVTLRLRRDKDGRNLFPSEKVGDAVTSGESLTLTRYVQAGGCTPSSHQ